MSLLASLALAGEVGASIGPVYVETMRSILRLASVLVLLTPTVLAAQPAGVLPKSTHLPASTRAMAMGDSYQMNAGHADAIFYHPALLTNARGFGMDTQRWSAAGTASAASGAMQWLGGGIGIGLRTLQYGGPGTGAASAPAGQAHLFTVGSVPVSERIATVAYARSVFAGIAVGAAVDLMDVRVGTASQNVTLFDISASRDVGPVVLGLTAHDIGSKPVVDSGNGPSAIVLGAGAYGKQLGIFDLGFAANAGLADDDLTWGGGVEIGYWPIQGRTYVVRFGFDDSMETTGPEASPFTTGLAFWGDNITVEWAFRPVSGADEGGTHRFGVRFR